MSDIRRGILKIFDKPEWYEQLMTKEEERKLLGYVMEASCVMEARLFRLLDCSAYCVESKCFFCQYPKHAKKFKLSVGNSTVTMTSENTAQDTSSTVTVLSDEEIVTQFCLANKARQQRRNLLNVVSHPLRP